MLFHGIHFIDFVYTVNSLYKEIRCKENFDIGKHFSAHFIKKSSKFDPYIKKKIWPP